MWTGIVTPAFPPAPMPSFCWGRDGSQTVPSGARQAVFPGLGVGGASEALGQCSPPGPPLLDCPQTLHGDGYRPRSRWCERCPSDLRVTPCATGTAVKCTDEARPTQGAHRWQMAPWVHRNWEKGAKPSWGQRRRL